MQSLKEILSVSGESSLFKLVSQGRNGLIVESLETKKRTHLSSNTKVSSLKEIAIYTKDKEVALSEVLTKIAEKTSRQPALDAKASPEQMKEFFLSILPDYDTERVYASDIKKVIRWYNQLQALNMLDFEPDKDDEPGVADALHHDDKQMKPKPQPFQKPTVMRDAGKAPAMKMPIKTTGGGS